MSGSRRPAALLVTPVLPQLNRSGRATRAWHWLVELAREHEVHVLVAGPLPRGFELSQGHPATSIRSVAEAVRTPGRHKRLAGILFPPLVLATRHVIADWRSPIGDALAGLASIPAVRKIVVFRLYLHDIARQLFARHPEAERILDMDDLESQTRASLASGLFRAGRPGVALRLFASSLQYRLIEARLARSYATTFLACHEDARTLGRRSGGATGVRPNWVPDPGAQQARAIGDRLSLLFVGSLDYFPNEEAARFIVQSLVPRLRDALALPFHVTIVGRGASPALTDLLATCPEVDCRPDAEELTSLYEQADIVLVPLWSGGGTKLKTLEALAHACPVIATPEGVRGLSVKPSQHFLAVDGATEFTSAIAGLANGEIDGLKVAGAGRRFWEAHHRLLP